ncbi:helix-turn-helix domain-containing protein [Desulfovibrio sp. ZJ200]|uniref:helix-turn-helix domain-containing protein n=1 Tax=Desulfovibrio sp. ZJ200 TaxID=2709792 RepID=UPI0013EB9D4E|nr:helix-turn-helix domain-containing protein [Desulfovibrio sp. ZJ200]
MELAAILGIKQSSISDSKRRQSVPSDWYMKLFEKLGVNLDWVKKGTGPIYLRTEAGYCPSNGENHAIAPRFLSDLWACFEIINVYSMNGRYTEEIFHLADTPCIGKIVIPKPYAQDGIFVFQTYTDEASPFVYKNSYSGIDRLSTYPLCGDLFSVPITYEGIFLRKIFWNQEEKCFILRAKNTEFPEICISLEQKEYILGKLFWILQKV